MKSYSEAMKFETYGDRLAYLSLHGVHHESPRDISNKFYKSPEWRRVRKQIIKRDLGRDLAVNGKAYEIEGDIIVHHINPITQKDLDEFNVDILFNPENLITVSVDTHNTIHYRTRKSEVFVERQPGDTKLW